MAEQDNKMIADLFGNEIDAEEDRLSTKAEIQQHDLDIEDLIWKLERLQKQVRDLETTSADHETRITALEP